MIEQIKRYLSDNLDKYSYEALHAQLLKAGYLEEDISEAKEELDLERGKKHEDVMIFPSPNEEYPKKNPQQSNRYSQDDNSEGKDSLSGRSRADMNQYDSQDKPIDDRSKTSDTAMGGVGSDNHSSQSQYTRALDEDSENLDYLNDDSNSDTSDAQPPSEMDESTSVDSDSRHFMNSIVLLLVSLVTFCIYLPFWYLKQNKALAENGKRTMNNVPISVYLVLELLFGAMLLISVITFFFISTSAGISVIEVLDVIANLILFIGVIMNFVLAFKLRNKLYDEYGIQANGALTFLFTFLYLQILINNELKN